jgi:hypothetical protein
MDFHAGSSTNTQLRRWTATLEIPNRETTAFGEARANYEKTTDAKFDDDAALTSWLLQRSPHFFETNKPYIKFVQMLYEFSLPNGQRVKSLQVTASSSVSGWRRMPTDRNSVAPEKNKERKP